VDALILHTNALPAAVCQEDLVAKVDWSVAILGDLECLLVAMLAEASAHPGTLYVNMVTLVRLQENGVARLHRTSIFLFDGELLPSSIIGPTCVNGVFGNIEQIARSST